MTSHPTDATKTCSRCGQSSDQPLHTCVRAADETEQRLKEIRERLAHVRFGFEAEPFYGDMAFLIAQLEQAQSALARVRHEFELTVAAFKEHQSDLDGTVTEHEATIAQLQAENKALRGVREVKCPNCGEQFDATCETFKVK